MKKLFFIMAMSVCAFTAQAQTTSGIRVGLRIFLNLFIISCKSVG